jgi:transcription antitermination factor NusG
MPWFVIYTKSRFEKKVATGLESIGIETYCPMVKTVRQWSDRKKKVEVPLIPSYVFVNMEEKDRNKVFEVHGVVQFLFWLKRPAIIRPEEIEILRRALAKTIKSFEVEKRVVGSEIEISAGPFLGKKGKIEAVTKNKTYVILDEIGCRIILHYNVD